MFKKIKLVFLSLLSLFSFQLSSCKTGPTNLKYEVSFDILNREEILDYFALDRKLLVKNIDSFNNFINDETLFNVEESRNFFKDAVKKYNNEYFESKDLAILF